LMKVDFKASPNKSKRPNGQLPTYIVLHHTGPGSFEGISKWLCDKDAKASAHYVISNSGKIVQLVDTKYKAWHAGISEWNDLSDINRYSIGIEICNLGILQKGEDDNYYYEQGRNLKRYSGKVAPIAGEIVYPDGRVLRGYHVPYPEKQKNAIISLCKGLIKKYPQIQKENIISHFQISPGRKNDPFGLDINEIINMVFYG